ncbi:MAG: penicillin acylase family protein, partial [Chloroflexi bacterium]
TCHGPIINALIENEKMESPLALRWTALEPVNTLKTVLDMNRASSCATFREALRGWLYPTQNFVSADRQGNIAYSFPGHIPMRARGDGSVPAPGWTGEYEWLGYIPYEELPHMFNPAPGYIASANNRVVDDGYPHWVSPDFCASSRAGRIVELIEARGVLGVEDVRRMHIDQVSILAREMMGALADVRTDDPELVPIFDLFHGWDGHISATDPRAAIYEVFVQRLIAILTTPKLGELAIRYAGKGPTPVLSEGSMFAEHSREWLLGTLADLRSPWWDTGDGRSRAELICQAMRETVEILQKSCGPYMENWHWGKIHTLTFGHPLGGVKPLDRIFLRGPFPIGGDGDTIWAASGTRYDLSQVEIVGPPFRFIADLGNWNNSLGMLVPGQSGHPASPHYDDNIEGWFKGEYHPMLFDREKVKENVTDTLILEP